MILSEILKNKHEIFIQKKFCLKMKFLKYVIYQKLNFVKNSYFKINI